MPAFSINKSLPRRIGVPLLVFSVCGLYGDTLILRNGNRFDGQYQGQDHTQVRFASGGHTNSFLLADVVSIQITQGASPGPGSVLRSVIPAGTRILIRTIDIISSDHAYNGQLFRASVESPVWAASSEVIHAGTECSLVLDHQRDAGTFAGRTVYQLKIRSLDVSGHEVEPETSAAVVESRSKGAATAGKVGGGAVLGSIIGGVVGGARGAAIGAASGAGAGVVAAVATSGEKIRVPSETLLSFILTQPLPVG